MDLNISGLASGFDWTSFVNQMVAAEQQPEQALRLRQSTLNQQKSAYGAIQTELNKFKDQLASLQQASFFSSRLAQSSNASITSASAAAETPLGQYAFDIKQLATASFQQGLADAGGKLSASSDVSALVLANAAFATSVTGGTFTVNGQQIKIAATDTLQSVFAQISTQTGGAITASYNSTTDKITLTSSSAIVLGSATDTSNFLRAAKLNNNGTGTVTSATGLGAVRFTGSVANACATPISDNGSGTGEFLINGVSITFAAQKDSLADVISRINNSTAGVVASYDSVNDRLLLTSRVTGDLGIALQDVSGNFLAATGLSGGALQRGNDLLYSVNGGPQLNSHSNTITAESSGVTGLSVTALGTGLTTVSVVSDTASIKQTISDFIDEYNKVQNLISTDTANSTDASGKVTAGILASNHDASQVQASLRRLLNATIPGLSDALNSLDDLGIASNGYDSTLKLNDESKLDAALADRLGQVQALFTDPANGLATKLSAFLDDMAGDDGLLSTRQTDLTKQSQAIDTQIANMEKTIQADKQRMINEFTAMEQTQAKINQQLTYLLQTFGGSSSSATSSAK